MCRKLCGKRFHSGAATTATSSRTSREDLMHARARRRVVLGVQAEVEQRELQLPHRLRCPPGTCARRAIAAARSRQRLARLDMPRDQRQHFGAPREVLHELARQLDRIPRDAVDAGDARVVHARQHVVQAVAELVEHRHDFVVRQQRGLAADRRQEVADQVGDRQRRVSAEILAADALVHPRAAALLRRARTGRGRSRRAR